MQAHRTARDIRRYNRSVVLTELFFNAPLSRPHPLPKLDVDGVHISAL